MRFMHRYRRRKSLDVYGFMSR